MRCTLSVVRNEVNAFESAAGRYNLGRRGVWALAAVARLESAREDLYRAALALGGTVTGEHGIGAARRDWLVRQRLGVVLHQIKTFHVDEDGAIVRVARWFQNPNDRELLPVAMSFGIAVRNRNPFAELQVPLAERRDLRLQDNPALAAALAQCAQVHCVFVFDTEMWSVKARNASAG